MIGDFNIYLYMDMAKTFADQNKFIILITSSCKLILGFWEFSTVDIWADNSENPKLLIDSHT